MIATEDIDARQPLLPYLPLRYEYKGQVRQARVALAPATITRRVRYQEALHRAARIAEEALKTTATMVAVNGAGLEFDSDAALATERQIVQLWFAVVALGVEAAADAPKAEQAFVQSERFLAHCDMEDLAAVAARFRTAVGIR